MITFKLLLKIFYFLSTKLNRGLKEAHISLLFAYRYQSKWYNETLQTHHRTSKVRTRISVTLAIFSQISHYVETLLQWVFSARPGREVRAVTLAHRIEVRAARASTWH